MCCGYGGEERKLLIHFHHIDPSTKEFQIDESGMSKSWQRIIKELRKCVPLCIRCHGEHHVGLITRQEIDVFYNLFWKERDKKVSNLHK